jgi:hypothetical protein
MERYPKAAQTLRQLRQDGDVTALHRLVARLAAQSLARPIAELVGLLDGQPGARDPAAVGLPDAAPPTGSAPLAELRTVQKFRGTWSRLRMEDQLNQSRQQGPENPGPLNSHLLVLRALQRMQELSPAYLEHYMAHANALMWLESAELRRPAAPATPEPRARSTRKSKAGKPPAR